MDGDLVDPGCVHHEADSAADIGEIQVEVRPAGDGDEVVPVKSAILGLLAGGDVHGNGLSVAFVGRTVWIDAPE